MMVNKARVKCYYLSCKRNRLNSPTTSMFRLPQDSERCKIWLTCMGRLDLMAKPSSTLHEAVRVCADHFEDKCFSSTLRTRLMRFAEPVPIGTAQQITHTVQGPIPGLATTELEAQIADYVKFLHKGFAGNGGATTPPASLKHRQESSSPPTSTSPQEATLSALDVSHLKLWNFCNSTAMPPPPPEPQKEALNLAVCDQNNSTPAPLVKREISEDTGPPHTERLHVNENGNTNNQKIPHGTTGGSNNASGVGDAHIKITSRGDGRSGMDNSLVVSMEINGVLYQGVLFAQNMLTRMT